jgi:hypothetical protein
LFRGTRALNRRNVAASAAFSSEGGNASEGPNMRSIAALLVCASCTFAAAQAPTVPQGPDHPGSACPPGTGPNAPTVGKDQSKPLSDQLAESKGVICPPAGVDTEMRVTPPEGGAMRVIPPPGAPGGKQDAQPK